MSAPVPSSPSVPAIETFELSKRFGRTVALAGLSMRVEPGEVFGFLGPNGAGKTTSVKLLLGLTAAELGQRPGPRARRSATARPAAGSATCPSSSATSPGSAPGRCSGCTPSSPGCRRGARSRRGRRRPRDRRPRGAGQRPRRDVLEGDAAAARAGRGPARRARARLPRRADLGPRPGRTDRGPPDHPGGSRARRDRLPELAPPLGGRAGLRPGRRRQPRPGRGQRHARRAARRAGRRRPGQRPAGGGAAGLATFGRSRPARRIPTRSRSGRSIRPGSRTSWPRSSAPAAGSTPLPRVARRSRSASSSCSARRRTRRVRSRPSGPSTGRAR